MFTGLVQRIGTVKRVSRGAGLVLEIAADEPWSRPLEPGESVAVNGVCLTVVKCDGSRFTADVLRETESRTGLGDLFPGGKVNLERALRAGEAMGGHIVQGHVDCRGTVAAKIPRGRDFRLRVNCGRVLAAQSVLKGSIAIDGVSLTISDLGDDWLAVDLIPVTARETTLGSKNIGDKVNLEGDVVGKYAAKAVSSQGLTEEALRRAGFIEPGMD
jgi:riboflavin synthase